MRVLVIEVAPGSIIKHPTTKAKIGSKPLTEHGNGVKIVDLIGIGEGVDSNKFRKKKKNFALYVFLFFLLFGFFIEIYGNEKKKLPAT